MTDDQLQFLRVVLANPDDDVARLQFADACEDAGDDARAEFVRVQVELAKTPRWKFCGATTPREDGEIHHGRECYALDSGGTLILAEINPAWEPLKARAHELVKADLTDRTKVGGCRWADWPLNDVNVMGDGSSYEHVRGFVATVVCSSAAWIAHGDAILAQHPVRRVRLTDRPELRCVSDTGEEFGYEIVAGGEVAFTPNLWLGAPDEMPPDIARELTRRLLADEWGPKDGQPGVTFELPPEPEFDLTKAWLSAFGLRMAPAPADVAAAVPRTEMTPRSQP